MIDYGDFTLSDLESKFGIRNQRRRLFDAIAPVEPGEKLRVELLEIEEMPIRSEKAKSEWIVVPILKELRQRNDKFFTIYSGENLNSDEARGLKGECDFILARDTGSFDISFPILQIVEAKKNDLEVGVPQCTAQLLGARVFNEKKGLHLDTIYGCVTTGNDWLFMKLENDLVIDSRVYYLVQINELLGIFQYIIGYYRRELAD
jgi:hypothetical protein